MIAATSPNPVSMYQNPNGAVFCSKRVYRYVLWRRWSPKVDAPRLVAFVGLNPSTADERKNDPTIRRCIGFARKWRYHGMVMLNLFAYRATQPTELKSAQDPVGPDNDRLIGQAVSACDAVVCCWGVHGILGDRHVQVRRTLAAFERVFHLGLTRNGQPRHPLYLPHSARRRRWRCET